MGAAIPSLQAGLLNQSSAQVIDGSLKFVGSRSNYLQRLQSGGNRRTFTWSGWIKQDGAFSGTSNNDWFTASEGDTTGGSDYGFGVRFYETSHGSYNNALMVYEYENSAFKLRYISNRKFRDFSAFYHIVVAVDTTQTTDTDRVRVYVNGEEITSWSTETHPSTNLELTVNESGKNSQIGCAVENASTILQQSDGLANNFYLIDGQALGPENFGFTDPLTNTWRPKKYEGVFNGDAVAAISYSDNGQMSSSASFNGAPNDAAASFDGSIAGPDVPYLGGSSAEIVWTPTGTLSYSSQIEIYVGGVSGFRYNLNNGGWNTTTINSWNTIATGSGTITTIKVDRGGDATHGWHAIRIDGTILVNSPAQNAGVNGFYLPMDNDDFHIDKSGNGNNWTKNNFSGTFNDPDVLKDSPSGAVSGGRAQTGITTTSSAPSNYATWNPLFGENQSLSNGNLKAESNTTDYAIIASTIAMKSGKWYMEYTYTPNNGQPYITWGISQTNRDGSQGSGVTDTPEDKGFKAWDSGFYSQSDGSNIYNYSSSVSSGDIISLAFDADAGNLWVAKNGTYMTNASGAGNPTAGTNPDYSGLNYSGGYYFMAGPYYTNGSTLEANFGQKPFKYAPPQGYLPLNSASATPETVITRPNQFVGVTTYTGNDATTHPITGLNFGAIPDFVWIKNRDQTEKHILHDTVRGIGNTLYSNNSDQADTGATYSARFKSFDFNGFTVGTDHSGTNSTDDFVAWCWKAGGNKNTFNVDDVGYASAAAAGLTGGSITPTGSSVGTRQGFSIIQYQGNGSRDQSIPHGLTQAPDFSIIKNMDGTANWTVFHRSVTTTNQKVFYLNTNGAVADYSNGSYTWWHQLPDASLFYIGDLSTAINNGTNDMISYHWHDVPGLQKFGSYVGNGDNDGVYIELGFAPKVLLTKSSSAGGDWQLWDTSRQPYNPNADTLAPNTDGQGSDTSGYKVDMLSSGVKFRMYGSSSNNSGVTYIYAAWAEAPTFNLYGAQSNAR